MSRYTIALKKPEYPKIYATTARTLCFTTFLMIQITVMATDLLILGVIIAALSYLSIISWGIALFALTQWGKSGAFLSWKKKNIKKFYRVMCTNEQV